MPQRKLTYQQLSQINQQLMMEISELRNAFNLNKKVLEILSKNHNVDKKQFYVMLKKLTEYISDVSQNQIELRSEKIQKQIQIKELEHIIAQHIQQLSNLQNQSKNSNYNNLKNKDSSRVIKTFQPIQQNMILMDKFKTAIDKINKLKQKISELQSQNIQLKINQQKCSVSSRLTQATCQSQIFKSKLSICSRYIQQQYPSSQQLQNKVQKLTRVNNHLNNSLELVQKSFLVIDKIKKKKVNVNMDILVQLICSRVKMSYLDELRCSVLKKRPGKGKSL